ncbi:MAG TPA: hypothetical protein VD971_05510 [Phycisphaerales bacterium]|nr:hypothetical protein [Phycisphaerales bacterium]
MNIRVVGCALALAMSAGWAVGQVTNVTGRIRYTARTGLEADAGSNALRPSRGVKVELWDHNADGTHVKIGETWTDDTGNYTFTGVSTAETDTTPPDTAGVFDPFVVVAADSRPMGGGAGQVKSAYRVAAVGPNNTTPGAVHTVNTDSLINPGGPVSIDLDMDTSTASRRAFSVFDAMTAAARNHSYLPGTVNNTITAVFPKTAGTSFYNGTLLHILEGDRHDWDVVGHEYGHFLSSLYGMENNPGGGHSSRNNLRFSRAAGGDDLPGSNILNRQQADRLAWGEGWASYFGISANILEGTPALNIQRAGDTIYNDNDDGDGTTQGLRYGIESRHVGGRPSRGEDNEASVSRILLDLADFENDADDHDRVSIGYSNLHSILDTANVTSMTECWSALAAQPGVGNDDLIDYGAIFMRHNAASTPDISSVHGDVYGIFDPAPAFTWTDPTGGQTSTGFGTSLFHDFKIIIMDSAFTIVHDSGWLGDVNTYTPGALTWLALVATNQSENMKWVVASRETTNEVPPGGGAAFSYTSGGYWSDALSFYVIPAPGAAALLGLAGLLATRRRRG